jgi:DNA-binding response OmpR family regulator
MTDSKKKKILVIEDDIFLRKIINKKLLEEDYLVIEAPDGEKGLKAVKEKKPDLVLLDLVLPEMDGFEALEKIKKDPATFKIPVIILSNLGQKYDIEKGLKAGAADYLVKAHFTPGEIISRIEAVLKKSAQGNKN